MPSCLCVYIIRTGWSSSTTYKRNDVVQFPLSLSLHKFHFVQQQATLQAREGGGEANYLSTGGESPCSGGSEYNLTAVVLHHGLAGYGHFTCYRRGLHALANQWFHCDDKLVTPASAEQVLRANPYLLFYERRVP